MNDFVIQDGLLTKYDGDGADVVITDSVTSIGALLLQVVPALNQ